MKIALFGGTFNPVHSGHLLMAESARDHFKLDQVIFLPTGQPPHKEIPTISAKHRLAMLRLAIRGNPAFHLSDWEIHQKRVVYTFEALVYFKQCWPRAQQHFLIGSDSLSQISGWRQGYSLLEHCPFLVVERPEVPWKNIAPFVRKMVRRVDSDPVPFSSRDIRRRVHDGRSIRYQVPDAVAQYIRRHRLYRKEE